jgi:hypothetical protein
VTQAGAAAADASGTGGASKAAAQAGAGKAGAAAAAAKVETYFRNNFFSQQVTCEKKTAQSRWHFEAFFLPLLRRLWRRGTNTLAFCLGLHILKKEKKSAPHYLKKK